MSPSSSATCRSRCSRRGSSPARTCCRARSSNPRSLRTLLGDDTLDDMPSYGPVPRESVYLLTGTRAVPVPPPPTMRNHGNVIVSLSELGRWLAARAEDGGAMILPETAAQSLLVADGRVVGVRTGDKGRGSAGETLGNFEPGSDIVAQRDRAGRGHAGPSHRCRDRPVRPPRPRPAGVGARGQGGVEGPAAARSHHPHDGVAAAPPGQVPRVRRLVHLSHGRRHAEHRHGRRSRLPRPDAVAARSPAASSRPIRRSARCSTVGSGSNGAPRPSPVVATMRSRSACTRRDCSSAATAPGMVNIPTLKGVHYAIEAGRLAAETAFAAIRACRRLADRARALRRRRALQLHRAGPLRSARHARRVRARLRRRRRAAPARCHSRRGASTSAACAPSPTTPTSCCRSTPPRRIPCTTARSRSTGSRRCSPRATRRATTNRITSGSSRASRPTWRELWAHLCPAQVYTRRRHGRRRSRHRRRRAVELRAVRRDLGQGRAAHTPRRRLRPGVLPHLTLGSLAPCTTRYEESQCALVYWGVRSRSCGGLAGICQRRKPLSYFSW